MRLRSHVMIWVTLYSKSKNNSILCKLDLFAKYNDFLIAAQSMPEKEDLEASIVESGPYVLVQSSNGYLVPAIIINRDYKLKKVQVRMMEPSGRKYWKWPDKNIESWIEPNQLPQIGSPKRISNRGSFDVPEAERDYYENIYKKNILYFNFK